MTSTQVLSGRLPKKEAEIFRVVVNSYETKQYRKGLKSAENILKKFPNHGETLAMKGLILNCTGKKDEAYDLVKLGLRNDVRSHICWHVYGLIYRSDNNYKEAIKCYLNALRIDTDNQNILRDLSWLQIQMRDIVGFMSSRKKILDSRPTFRPSWIAYVVATFLGGEYALAFNVVEKYNETVKDRAGAYEEGELLLFQNRCLEKQRKYEEAILHLEKHESSIVDKLALKVKLAEYYVRVGKFNIAQDRWLSLVTSQTENYRFHCGLQIACLEISDPELCDELFDLKRLELPSTSLSLSIDQRVILKTVYEHKDLQKSRATNKILLTFSTGDEFHRLLDRHMRNGLRDGVPALHHDVCCLIRGTDPHSPVRVRIVTDPYDFRQHPAVISAMVLVKGYVASLRANGRFDNTTEEETDVEVPTALLWTLFLQCQLLERCGQLTEALAVIEECIDHTPTALDMLAKKAHLLKKLGSISLAATTMDGVRQLDLQDRYLNNKTAKYLLRSNLIPKALDTIALFTKHDDDNDPQQTLYDLQCNWFELELAEAHCRLRHWGQALKKFHAVLKHFVDYVEDMFDFHHFSIRKTTLRMYADCLAMQDGIFCHKFFQRAARGAMTVYLHLLDCPEDLDGLGHLSAADRRKERAKLKKRRAKELAKAEALKKVQSEEAKWDSKKDEEAAVKKDPDPLGETYLQKNFLAEAGVWCGHLAGRISGCEPATLCLVSEVMMRRGKYLQAARALRCCSNAAPLYPDLKVMLARFAKRAHEAGAKDPVTGLPIRDVVLKTVRGELRAMLLEGGAEGGAVEDGLEKLLASYIAVQVKRTKESTASLEQALATARAVLAAAPADKQAASLAASLLLNPELWSGKSVSCPTALSALQFIEKELKMEEEAAAFRSQAAVAFPLCEALVSNGVAPALEAEEDD